MGKRSVMHPPCGRDHVRAHRRFPAAASAP